MSIRVVYAMEQALTEIDGARMIIPKGSHWPAEDPVVKRMPELFSSDPRWGLAYSVEPDGYNDPPTEQATAAPGERRNVRRG